MKVYIDGQLQPAQTSDNIWGHVSTYSVPSTTTVIGIECEDLHVYGGILASLSNGVVTDDGWSCSTQHVPGWSQPSFTATGSQWFSATEHGANGVSPWATITGISSGAQWIWSPNYLHGDRQMYCRRVLTPRKYMSLAGCLRLILFARSWKDRFHILGSTIHLSGNIRNSCLNCTLNCSHSMSTLYCTSFSHTLLCCGERWYGMLVPP